MGKNLEKQDASKQQTRKQPIKAVFHFPIYPLSVALEIAEKVEKEGNGTLSESTLAMSMGLSMKGSGFQLKVLTAKQFGLLAKQGDTLMTTQLAKSIFKPITQEEKAAALSQAFHNIALFKAVSDKYQGSPLPSGDAFKNVLEREFQVISDRSTSAQSMVINSAKTAGILQQSQGKEYLVRKSGVSNTLGDKGGEMNPPPPPPPPPGTANGPIKATLNISVDTKDFNGMDAEAIKAAMAGLERLARIVVLKQTEENNENKT